MLDKQLKAKIIIKGGNRKTNHVFYENVVSWDIIGRVLELIALLEYRKTGKK